MFYIVSYRDIGWYEIYDLLDVMGGVERIVKRRWANDANSAAYAKPRTTTGTAAAEGPSTSYQTTPPASAMAGPWFNSWSRDGWLSA